MAVKTFPVYGFDRVTAAEGMAAGQVVYPVHYTHIHEGSEWYGVWAQPGRKNMSHEPCVSGWLGTTNDVQATALGAGEVISVQVRFLKDGRERADVKVRM